jgi:predicted ABC-type ATPase
MLSDYLRNCLIRTNERLFSFETVLAHQSKIDYLHDAKELGWSVYLYFVSTSDPDINYARIKQRVQKGEHDVPLEKIYDRYTKSHNNLYSALKHCKRAYIFDNSIEMELIAEMKPDGSFDLLTEYSAPRWLNDCLFSKM